MLKSLYIQNYALIETLDIDFSQGFSVITGETGAGKSIILGAIGLLLGQRADSKSAKDSSKKCTIEATFHLQAYHLEGFFEENDLDYDGNDCIIRREIMPNGKSRAFINDTPATVGQLKELGEMLIDIHSQHQNLLLNKEDFQLGVIDTIANDKEEIAVYATLFNTYKEKERQLKKARAEALQANDEEEYLRFQLQQLDEADLKEGDQEELEQEAELLNHAEEIKQSLFHAECLLEGEDGGIISQLKEATQQTAGIARVYPEAEDMAGRLESCLIELKDIYHDICSHGEKVEFNPTRLEWINDRLNTIYSLQQKHKTDSVTQLIELREDIRRKLDHITNADEYIRELEKACQQALEAVKAQGDILTRLRKTAAVSIEEQMKERLIPLGIPNVQFKVEITPKESPDESGYDKVNFLFSANKNARLQPISEVASGGEIARVMLSLKAMLSGAVKLPTIIFDEIDTGVSGSIAEKMAHIMREMGAHDRQVISITHLPQIAALGSHHYKVYKEDDDTGTTSHIIQLSAEERVSEIAHMLSGSTLTDAAINNAKELLSQAQ